MSLTRHPFAFKLVSCSKGDGWAWLGIPLLLNYFIVQGMGELDYASICFLILIFIWLKLKQRNWTTLHKFNIFIKNNIIINNVYMCIHYLTNINLCKYSPYKPHMSTFHGCNFISSLKLVIIIPHTTYTIHVSWVK